MTPWNVIFKSFSLGDGPLLRSTLGTILISVGIAAASAQGAPYSWPTYNPTISYNFKDEFPTLSMPTKDLDDCSGIAGGQSDGWWTFKWGSKKNSLVTGAAITPLLARMNKDFAYFRDTMGWPPDKRAQDGYRSAVYLYGSGLCTDNAANTEKGGWQSAVGAYPMVLLSYYPVYCFDPACTYGDKTDQMGACVHEGIHSVLASLPGAKKAAWFQEGGNTWLQQQASAQQTNNFSTMGFLNGCTFLAPFMPIECYSGWLQDGSFGGPSAEGVDKYDGSQQICTWRTYLGGNQYGNGFPTFLGVWLGLGSVPWVWKNCPGRVLEGIAAKLGDSQIRRLIMEYRAKQALLDMEKWSNACKAVLNDHFGASIGPEWTPYWINCDAWKATPYAKTTDDGNGLLTPEKRTLPGWSGANQIPLTVNGSLATVDFQPIGANMSCQLCYRAKDGTPVYGAPVSSGPCSLLLDKAPNSSVIIAVVCNTDYKYLGDTTRKAHYDYRLKLGTGIAGAADIYTKWYNVNLPVTSTGPNAIVFPTIRQSAVFVKQAEYGRRLTVEYDLHCAGIVRIGLFSPSGVLIKSFPKGFRQAGRYTERLVPEKGISPGMYLIKLTTDEGSYYAKAVVDK
jgi:hypothetical protein